MSAAAILAGLAAHGTKLVPANNGVNLKAIGKPLTPDLRQQIVQHKAELLACLRHAANDPGMVDWHAIDRAYLAHHAQCTQCQSAGRRRGERCATGAALWRAYEAAPSPFTGKPQKPASQGADAHLLEQAAMRACDCWRDGAQERDAMRQWCATVPNADRARWIAYFLDTYPIGE